MNRLVSKDVSDNIIAGAVMALSSMKNMSLKFVTYKDADNVTVGYTGCLIPIKMGDYWGLIDTATDVNTTTDLDTGSLAPSTTYYIYVVTNGSTITFKTSINSSAPSGYTTSTCEKLGEFATDGSNNISSTSVRDIKTKMTSIYLVGPTANNVNISGGSISGITDIAIADGGTGASTASAARTALGVAIGSDIMAYEAWPIHEDTELCSVD